MNRPVLIAVVVVAFAVILTGWSAFFTVTQWQQAVVLQFGAPLRSISEPGLQIKLPFLQDVLYFDKRVLEVDPPAQQVILGDQKRLDVDAYARFRILNPLEFYQRVTNESVARGRLSAIINSNMRRVLGSTSLAAVLSAERERIMSNILRDVGEEAKRLGIEMVDVRLRRARADREKIVLLAEAQREAQIERGKGDADAIKTYADAFGKDPPFFAFYRSMQAYTNALGNGDTTMVLSPSMDFLRYLEDPSGTARPAAPARPPAGAPK
jgi:membrane protease subunit HflC